MGTLALARQARQRASTRARRARAGLACACGLTLAVCRLQAQSLPPLPLPEPISALSSTLHLDHVPVVVRDLEAAKADMQALGFTIKPGRPHSGGIENASIKFGDGSYLELITAHNESDALSREYAAFLTRQEGVKYAFLRDDEAGLFTEYVRREGGRHTTAEPFAFMALPRAWQLPTVELIEYLSPARDAASILQHPNTAARMVALWMVTDRIDTPLAGQLGASPPRPALPAFDERQALGARLADDTCLLFVERAPGEPPDTTVSAVLIEVDALNRVPGLNGGRSIRRGAAAWVRPAYAHGVWLGFIPRDYWAATACHGN